MQPAHPSPPAEPTACAKRTAAILINLRMTYARSAVVSMACASASTHRRSYPQCAHVHQGRHSERTRPMQRSQGTGRPLSCIVPRDHTLTSHSPYMRRLISSVSSAGDSGRPAGCSNRTISWSFTYMRAQMPDGTITQGPGVRRACSLPETASTTRPPASSAPARPLHPRPPTGFIRAHPTACTCRYSACS